ncbi:MAG: DNA repair protein RecO [Chloroflexi bacterium]|nr:DNA repair protein RecO [Chloroflexota bacterium]
MDDSDRIINSEAFVITQVDYGEADRLYTIFTRSKGKIKAYAHGVRKAKSRKAGHLQTISLINLMLAKGKSFWVITQADTVEPYEKIKSDLVKTANAFYIFELINRFAPEDEAVQPLFNLVKDTMTRISVEDDVFMVKKFFELRLLKITGYMPNLTTCIQCGETILPEDQYFSAEQGGVLCPRCGVRFSNVRKISMLALKYLRFIQRSTYQELRKARLSQTVKEEMNSIMLYYLTYINERAFNTPFFIHQIEENDLNKGIGK